MSLCREMTLLLSIGERLEHLISERGLDKAKLARRLCALQQPSSAAHWRRQIIRWAQNETKPSRKHAALLGEALGCDSSEFLAADVAVAEIRRAEATIDELQAFKTAREAHEAEQAAWTVELTKQIARLGSYQRQPLEMPRHASRTRQSAES